MSQNTSKNKIIGIVGATASGKTELAMRIAGQMNCEIVCMDSMQIYRYMDIGTAKPTRQERLRIPHHMVDFLLPDASFSVAQYTDMARNIIDDIFRRGHIPMLVGGTGLYLRGLSLQQDYGGLPSDPAVREELNRLLKTCGPQNLHAMLAEADPSTASRLHPNDTRRVVRALEIFRTTGIPMSSHQTPLSADSPYDFFLYAPDLPREELHMRINDRVDRMMRNGLLDEVKALIRMGITSDMQSMQGLGYKQLFPVLTHGEDLTNAVERIKTGTRNYARRQLIWFRRDPRIHWLDISSMENAMKIISDDWENK